jgi:hypothetical protein
MMLGSSPRSCQGTLFFMACEKVVPTSLLRLRISQPGFATPHHQHHFAFSPKQNKKPVPQKPRHKYLTTLNSVFPWVLFPGVLFLFR